MLKRNTPTVLTIAGSDTFGGAGIQVDAKTIHLLGGYAFSSITAITSQNSLGVKKVYPLPLEIFKSQLETILDDIKVDAIKIGMLANKDILLVVIETIKKYKLKNIVLDTVLVSTSGKILLKEEAIELMIKELFPLVDIITPNLDEINKILNQNYLGEFDEVDAIAKEFFDLGLKSVLIKGGHFKDKDNAIDYLFEKDKECIEFFSKRINTTHTHGTGCILSSSIATYLALGFDLNKSVKEAKAFLSHQLESQSKPLFNYVKKSSLRKESIF